VTALTVGVMAATFYLAELILSPPFGLLSDRIGHHRVMQYGPTFGAVAVVITAFTTNLQGATLVFLVVIALTRVLEGASTAASVPSILGYIAMVTAGDEDLRGKASARFEGATLAGLGVGFIVAPTLYDSIGAMASCNAGFTSSPGSSIVTVSPTTRRRLRRESPWLAVFMSCAEHHVIPGADLCIAT
jgi:MFS family permease